MQIVAEIHLGSSTRVVKFCDRNSARFILPVLSISKGTFSNALHRKHWLLIATTMKSCNAARFVLTNTANYRCRQRQHDECGRITLRDESELQAHIFRDQDFAFGSRVGVVKNWRSPVGRAPAHQPENRNPFFALPISAYENNKHIQSVMAQLAHPNGRTPLQAVRLQPA